MLKAISITSKTEYLDLEYCRIVIYSVRPDTIVVMDTGWQEHPELVEFFRERGQKVAAILCSHPHIDHVGSNKILCETFGTCVYMAEKERVLVEKGAWPYDELDFSYPIRGIPEGETSVTIEGEKFTVIPTPGHTMGHLAFVTPDGVCYLGDAMMSEKYVRHAKLPYMEETDTAIISMEKLMDTHFTWYVAAHMGTFSYQDLRRTAQANIDKELSIIHRLEELLQGTMPVTRLAERLLRDLDIKEEIWHKRYVFSMAVSQVYTMEQMGLVTITRGIVSRNN